MASATYLDALPSHPRCEYCLQKSPDSNQAMHAQYDFVAQDGNWRYGCTLHWMEQRASRQIGPGHAVHLVRGQKPPSRAPGASAEPLPPTYLPKPVSAYENSPRSQAKAAGGSSEGRPARPAGERKKLPATWFDLEPLTDAADFKPKPGSVMAIALEVMEKNDGATLEDIQAAIGPKHDALKLLRFFNTERGFGFKKSDDGKIRRVR